MGKSKFVQRGAGKSGRVVRIKPGKKAGKRGRLDAVEPTPPRPLEEVEADWARMREELGDL